MRRRQSLSSVTLRDRIEKRAQVWKEHFTWADDQQTLTGLTPAGRVTIAALDMNSALRQEARPLWFKAGLLP